MEEGIELVDEKESEARIEEPPEEEKIKAVRPGRGNGRERYGRPSFEFGGKDVLSVNVRNEVQIQIDSVFLEKGLKFPLLAFLV